jgi:hypothetical protein
MFFGSVIAAAGGVYTSEKMLRPVPEYTRLSVRSMADSSSVGSRLDEVLAIFWAATPGAAPRPAFAAAAPVTGLFEDVLERVAAIDPELETTVVGAFALFFMAIAAGFSGWANSWK